MKTEIIEREAEKINAKAEAEAREAVAILFGLSKAAETKTALVKREAVILSNRYDEAKEASKNARRIKREAEAGNDPKAAAEARRAVETCRMMQEAAKEEKEEAEAVYNAAMKAEAEARRNYTEAEAAARANFGIASFNYAEAEAKAARAARFADSGEALLADCFAAVNISRYVVKCFDGETIAQAAIHADSISEAYKAAEAMREASEAAEAKAAICLFGKDGNINGEAVEAAARAIVKTTCKNAVTPPKPKAAEAGKPAPVIERGTARQWEMYRESKRREWTDADLLQMKSEAAAALCEALFAESRESKRAAAIMHKAAEALKALPRNKCGDIVSYIDKPAAARIVNKAAAALDKYALSWKVSEDFYTCERRARAIEAAAEAAAEAEKARAAFAAADMDGYENAAFAAADMAIRAAFRYVNAFLDDCRITHTNERPAPLSLEAAESAKAARAMKAEAEAAEAGKSEAEKQAEAEAAEAVKPAARVISSANKAEAMRRAAHNAAIREAVEAAAPYITPAAKRVLDCYAFAMSDKAIAAKLNKGLSTIHAHKAAAAREIAEAAARIAAEKPESEAAAIVARETAAALSVAEIETAKDKAAREAARAEAKAAKRAEAGKIGAEKGAGKAAAAKAAARAAKAAAALVNEKEKAAARAAIAKAIRAADIEAGKAAAAIIGIKPPKPAEAIRKTENALFKRENGLTIREAAAALDKSKDAAARAVNRVKKLALSYMPAETAAKLASLDLPAIVSAAFAA